MIRSGPAERVGTIFFGGGTPSLFKPESIAALIETVDRRCGIEPGAEVTLEANPGTVDLAKLAGFRAAGVNRISFGAQSFTPAILKFLGRIHNADQTRAAAEMAHRAGFERLNLDLIFAVPGQTHRISPAAISAKRSRSPPTTSRPTTSPSKKARRFLREMKVGRITPQSDDDQASMYADVRSEFPHADTRCTRSRTTRRAAMSRGITWPTGEAQSYLGIGAGAHSCARAKAGGRRWWNERSPGRYISMAARDGIAEAGAEVIDARAAAGEFVFLNLRLRDGFALTEFALRFGAGFDAHFGARAARLFENGLLLRENGRVVLSDRGLELADSVFAEFV